MPDLNALEICEECHAAVRAEAMALHEDWHQLIASALMRLEGRTRDLGGAA